MKLTDLSPRWVGAGGPDVTRNGQPVPERKGVGVSFDCPCGKCKVRVFVHVDPPLDGGPPYADHNWRRTGDTFETLTLSPSILRREPGSCGWHGWIRNGEVISC